jgi:hypothetical protein
MNHAYDESLDDPEENMISLDRSDFQDPFCEFLESIGLSGYGQPRWSAEAYPCDPDPSASVRNAVFCVRPFHWGENPDIEKLANFEHYPSGLQIRWYKYALRSGKANRDITLFELQAIFDECRASLGEGFDGGRPKPDVVGQMTRVKKTPKGTFVTVCHNQGTMTLYVDTRSSLDKRLVEGHRLAFVTTEGKPNRRVQHIFDAPPSA